MPANDLLLAPLLIFAGVVVKGLWDFFAAKLQSRVGTKQVAVSEKEANTHQFQAIVEGFTHSLAAVREEAERANSRADTLEGRLDTVERERAQEHNEIIQHLSQIEALVPNPPGPPPRPAWLRK